MSFSKGHGWASKKPLSPFEIHDLLDLADQYVALNRRDVENTRLLAGLTQIQHVLSEPRPPTAGQFPKVLAEQAGWARDVNEQNMSMQASSIKKGETGLIRPRR